MKTDRQFTISNKSFLTYMLFLNFLIKDYNKSFLIRGFQRKNDGKVLIKT